MNLTLNGDVFAITALKIADILKHIGIDGQQVPAYPVKIEGDETIYAFPTETDTNLPFWFVFPKAFLNERENSIIGQDSGIIVFAIQLFMARVDAAWPGEKTGQLMLEMGRVMAAWTTRVDDHLEYNYETDFIEGIFEVQKVGGIRYPTGISGLSVSPLQYFEESHVGLDGEVYIGITDVAECFPDTDYGDD